MLFGLIKKDPIAARWCEQQIEERLGRRLTATERIEAVKLCYEIGNKETAEGLKEIWGIARVD